MDLKQVKLTIKCPDCKQECQTKEVSIVQNHTGNIFVEVVADCIHLIPHTSNTELVDVVLRIDIRNIKEFFCGKDKED